LLLSVRVFIYITLHNR